jgi:deazaflavin-dependent oxidoreductase (nitroreductase family)
VGIVQSLGYSVPEPNAVQRAMCRVSSSRPGAWLFSRSMPSIDRALLRATRGGVALPRIAAGLPVMYVVTRGAKSGLRRVSPLLGIPHGDDLAVIGTQFGQPGTPGWYYNLRADPSGEVIYRDRSVHATAREALDDEREAIWARARLIYSGYDAYARRIGGRVVPIVVLTEAG